MVAQQGNVTQFLGDSSQKEDQRPPQVKFARGIISALEERNITQETAEKFGVEKLFYEGTYHGYAFPIYNKDGVLVAQKVKNTNPKKMKIVGDISKGQMFGMKAFPNAGKYLTIVEGEEDALAAYQMIKKYHKDTFEPPVISLNFGAGNSALRECKTYWEYINSFDTIVIAFDGDEIGKETAEKVAKLFPFKVRIMKFTDAVKNQEGEWEWKDSSDYCKNNKGREFTQLWYKAEKYVPKGVRTFQSLWDDMTKTELNTIVPFPWDGVNDMCEGMITGKMDVFKAHPKIGKCFGKGTSVTMWDGSVKPVEDIVEGDLLMGDDGTPRTVKSTVQGSEELFLVKQNKRMDYVVNKSHIMCLKNTDSKKKIDIPLEEYFDLKQQDRWKGYSSPILREESFALGLSPYVLGVWLGDGTADKPQYTSIDYEIIDAFGEECVRLGLKQKTNKTNITFDIVRDTALTNKFTKSLKQLGVFKNKHIPLTFFTASMDKRLELLAGLIDADGFYSREKTNGVGTYEITQKRFELSKGIQRLAQSCGFSASFKEVTKCCKYLGEEKCGTYYRVNITGELSRIPCKVARKQAIKSLTGRTRDPLITGIEVTSIGQGEYYGFVLDGNHRFLLEDCTVVHNTTVLSELVMHIRDNSNYNAGVIFLENTAKEIGLKLCGIRMNQPLDRPNQDIDWDALKKVHSEISEDDRITVFDPEDERTAENIFNKIMYFVKAHDCKYIFLDHASMLAYTSDNPDERKFLDKLFADLKQMTTSLNIYLGVVIHVNDDGKTRGSRAPVQLCDRLYSLQRDKLSSDDVTSNTTEFIVEENRYGGAGLASSLYYDHDTGRMSELDTDLIMKQKERQVQFDED